MTDWASIDYPEEWYLARGFRKEIFAIGQDGLLVSNDNGKTWKKWELEPTPAPNDPLQHPAGTPDQ